MIELRFNIGRESNGKGIVLGRQFRIRYSMWERIRLPGRGLATGRETRSGAVELEARLQW